MTATATFPLTNSDLAEMAGPSGQVRFPASFDEFGGGLGDAEFNVEYFDHEIIATMSYETDFHSAIATQVSYLLKSIFGGKKSFRVFNGNRPVCIPECEHAVFNPDGSVVALPSKVFEYRPGMTVELTPALIFEVLCKSTRSQSFQIITFRSPGLAYPRYIPSELYGKERLPSLSTAISPPSPPFSTSFLLTTQVAASLSVHPLYDMSAQTSCATA